MGNTWTTMVGTLSRKNLSGMPSPENKRITLQGNHTMFKTNNNSDISTNKPLLRCIEDQNSITINSNLKNNHQEQTETVNDKSTKSNKINNAENVKAENNTSCSSLNDRINILNKGHEESLLQEQIMMDTKCNIVEDSKTEKVEDIMKKVSTNLKKKSTADLNSSKLYQESVISRIDLTKSDTEVKAVKSKEMNIIIESSENTKSVQTTSITTRTPLKRNASESLPAFNKSKLKKMNMNLSENEPNSYNPNPPNLVDNGNITYKPKFSNQNIPTSSDVLDKGSLVSNSNDYTTISQPIHSDDSLSQLSAAVPIALPLLPSILSLSYDNLDQMDVQGPFDNDVLAVYKETKSLPRPELSIQTNHATPEPSIILSWTLSTNSQVDTIKAYEIFRCEPSLETNNKKHNIWEQIALVSAEPGIMAYTLTAFGLKGKMYFYSIRAKNVQDLNGPFSRLVSFK